MSLYEDGSVWYSRYYGYNLDGSRAMVMRDDAVNGSHWDVYSYDEVSGRLASVQDVWTGEANGFAWNPEGTLARWEQPNSYARVFGYDEEGRLVKIERDYGGGNVQVAYEYGYNSDGVQILERKYRSTQHWREYRLLGCGTGCIGGTLSLYAREHINGQDSTWMRAEEYVSMAAGLIYRVPQSTNEPSISFVLFRMENRYVIHYPDGQIASPYYTDSGGMQVGGIGLPLCAEKRDWTAGCVPYPVVPVPEVPPYLPPPVGGGDSGCGGKGSGSSPDSWCERNKSNPTPVNCQDCCDEKVLERVKDLPKDLCKKLKKCIEQQCRDTDPEARLECFKGCLVSTLGEWKAFPLLQKIKRYLECCYMRCLPDGKFDPPGPCKLPF